MSTPVGPELPSLPSLMRATVVSIVAAVLLLILVVLPAEYGIDPTGVGAWSGLTQLAAAGEAKPAPQPLPPGTAETAIRRDSPYRMDQTTLTLASGEGAEIKATMRQRDRFVFTWTAQGGLVDFDMHGEAAGAKGGEYSSYWKEDQQTSANGSFEAPFDGTHGWFWQNLGASPVTITVKTSGFYEKIGRP